MLPAEPGDGKIALLVECTRCAAGKATLVIAENLFLQATVASEIAAKVDTFLRGGSAPVERNMTLHVTHKA